MTARFCGPVPFFFTPSRLSLRWLVRPIWGRSELRPIWEEAPFGAEKSEASAAEGLKSRSRLSARPIWGRPAFAPHLGKSARRGRIN